MQKHRSWQGASETEWQEACRRESAIRSLIESGPVSHARADVVAKQITPSPANAPQIYFAYNDTSTSGDRRLNQIRNLSASTLVSQFDYSYSPRGQITRWQQQNSSSSQITALSLQYDPMGQLIGARNQDTASSAQLASNAFSYDPAGNRTGLQLDSQLSNETFNSLNQLVAQTGANGSLHFTGTVNKPSTVTVGGQIAQVDADGNFDALVPVISGVDQVTVTATDVNHPAVNSAQTYQVTVSPVGAPLSGVSYDANGNLTADGTGQTYEYDSLDRVTAINESATLRTEFAYDGLGRRAQMIERSSGAISSEQNFVYDGWNLAEERDTGNSVVRRYFAQGEQRLTTADSGSYFYTFDHLASVREMLDNTGAVRARYEYDVWGNRTKSSGDLDCDFGFTSYWFHPTSGLYLSPTRLYSSAFGRILSRDPLGESGGMNLYGYVDNDPVNGIDPTGLFFDNSEAAIGLLILTAALAAPEIANAPAPCDKTYPSQGPVPLITGIASVAVVPALGLAGKMLAPELTAYLAGLIGKAAAETAPVWPKTAEEMNAFLKVEGKAIPDTLTTPGRNKTVWDLGENKITLEQHPYHPNAPWLA